METWEQISLAIFGLVMVFMLAPRIKPMMERSKNAEEKHWGAIILLAAALIAFVFLLISSVQ
jgi:hypothetical protein